MRWRSAFALAAVSVMACGELLGVSEVESETRAPDAFVDDTDAPAVGDARTDRLDAALDGIDALDGAERDVSIPTDAIVQVDGGVDSGCPGPAPTTVDASQAACTGRNLLLINGQPPLYFDLCNPEQTQRDVWVSLDAGIPLPANWHSACWQYPESIPTGDGCGSFANGSFPYVETGGTSPNGTEIYRCRATGLADKFVVSTDVLWSGQPHSAAPLQASCVLQPLCP